MNTINDGDKDLEFSDSKDDILKNNKESYDLSTLTSDELDRKLNALHEETVRQSIKHNNTNHVVKITQLVLINVYFICMLVFGWYYVNKLITLVEKPTPHIVYILASFVAISVSSIYLILGSSLKAMFNQPQKRD